MDGMLKTNPIPAAALDELVRQLAGRAADHDRDGSIAFDSLRALHGAGLPALTVSPAYGGAGGGLREVAGVVGRLAQGDPSVALILSMQLLQHAEIARSARWPEAVRRLVSREAVRDGALLNALRVEPELGTPARGGLPATCARRTAEGWRISGRKIYSTGSHALRWGVVWARTEEDAPRVGGFLVPLAADGVRIEPSWDQLGMRGTESHTVVLDDVAVPPEHAVDIRAPEAWQTPNPVQAVWGSITIAALYDGIARAARRWLLEFLRQRAPANLGAALATLPRFHELVGEIDALLLANHHLIEGFLAATDRGEAVSDVQAALAKHVVSENAIRAVEKGIAAIGNPGLSRSNPLERHYRDVLCARVHTPQGDAALARAGRLALLG